MRWANLVIAAIAVAGLAAYVLRGRRSTSAESRIDELIQRLRAPDAELVERAAEELQRVAKGGVTAEEAARLLRAATGEFPDRKYEFLSTPADLVRAAAEHPAGVAPVVSEVFGKLTEAAKTEALVLLMKSEERAAAETVIELLRARRRAGERVPVRTTPLQRDARHADVYFPALLEFADDANELEICAALLAACEARAFTRARLDEVAPRVLALWRKLRGPVRAAQAPGKPGWSWEDDYQEPRERAGMLLDLLGHMPGEAVVQELRAAVDLADPKLRYFAAVSLLRAGEQVPQAVIEDVAASAELRKWLHESLTKLGKLSLYPARWNSQQAFAEGEMVGWLVFPTELGRAPDEIELMRVVSEKFADGVFDWYLFRFRTHEPHWSAKDGWMAGVAGPFKRADAPSPVAYGDTFSSFEKWDAKSPDEHVAGVRELIDGWQRQHASR